MTRPQTKHPPGSLEALAEIIATRVKGVRPLKVVTSVPALPDADRGFDSATRDSVYKRVRWLRNTYRLHFLIDQATFDVPCIEALPDSVLSRLLSDMERARECLRDDVPFEDAGLIRAAELPSND